MSDNNKILEKVLLNMKYDSCKTLTENKKYLFESPTKNYQKVVNGEKRVFCQDTVQFYVPLTQLVKLGEGWGGYTYFEKDGWMGPSETGKENYVGFVKWGPSLYGACFVVYGNCNFYWFAKRYPEGIDEGIIYTLESFCNKKDRGITLGTQTWQLYLDELNPTYHSKTIKLLNNMNIEVGIVDSGKETKEIKIVTSKKQATKDPKQIEKERIEKQQAVIKKELETIKNDPNAPMLYPKDYVASKGMTGWATLKTLFCCPNKGPDSIKCNQNIAIAASRGWTEGQPVPKDLTFCKDNGTYGQIPNFNDDFELNTVDDVEEFFFELDYYVPGLQNAKFDGNLFIWFSENFLYPQEAINNNLEGVVNVTFTINTDGEITDIVGKGVNKTSQLLINAAIDLIKKMPNWIPATKDGIKITSRITLPIEFSLSEL